MTTLLFRFFNSINNNYSFNILLTIIYKIYIINSKECFLGNGLTTQYEYENEQGLLSKVSYGSSGKYQTFEYNLQGEPTFTQKDSLSYRYDYDDNGNLLKESLGVTRINEYTYDELNRLNTTLDEFSATTQYGYDANNNIVSKEISHYRGSTVNLSNAGTTVNGKWGNNFAQKWVDAVGGVAFAVNGRTEYANVSGKYINAIGRQSTPLSASHKYKYPVASKGVSWIKIY